jgi:hypothetical protein
MPHLFVWAIGALGAVVVGKWLAKEARRVNAELDSVRSAMTEGPADRPVLVRDSKTGVYRPKT